MERIKKIFSHSGTLILYGFILAFLVFALKWLQWKFLILNHFQEIYIGLIALFFTSLGIWVATRFSRGREESIAVRKAPDPRGIPEKGIDQTALEKMELSPREYEVLQLLVKGLSNKEISGELFLSVSTVKSHVSSLYVKMDVKRRAQAIEKANRLRIVPHFNSY